MQYSLLKTRTGT